MPTIIEDDTHYAQQCQHPGHLPGMYVSIPAGKRLRHTCPACGHETIIVCSQPNRAEWGERGVLDCPEIT